MLYQTMLRPLLFRLTQRDPERAHDYALALLSTISTLPVWPWLLRRSLGAHNPAQSHTVFGVRFPNPVGLAAGYDKDGVALPALAALGFGFIEVGTVTWHAQPGNPRPRVFRFTNDQALVNRMGFNNSGAQALATRLKQVGSLPVPIGISLGKSRITPPEQAIADYCASLRVVAPSADYVAINVSSPNTPGLRNLQSREHLEGLLAALQQEAQQHTATRTAPLPLLVKIAPDLGERAISQVLEVCANHRISGIIATNTFPVGPTAPGQGRVPSGGLSGRPLAHMAVHVVRFIHRETSGQFPIIGVGGIGSADDALRMIDAGASLVQVYTGFIFQGPTLLREITQALSR